MDLRGRARARGGRGAGDRGRPRAGRGGAPADGPAVAVEVRRGDTAIRGGDAAARGDRLRAVARRPAAGALWIYREQALVAACPGPACRADAATFTAELTLEVGTYRVIVVDSAAPTGAPAGVLDRDLAAASAAGARITVSRILVVR